jgi:hypothetical protein
VARILPDSDRYRESMAPRRLELGTVGNLGFEDTGAKARHGGRPRIPETTYGNSGAARGQASARFRRQALGFMGAALCSDVRLPHAAFD